MMSIFENSEVPTRKLLRLFFNKNSFSMGLKV